MRQVATNLASSFTPQDILPSLSVALVIWLLEVFVEVSFAALIFSGELAPFLATGVGLMLFGALIFGIIVSLTSSFVNAVALPQDTPIAIMGTVSAATVVLMPGADPERIFATVVTAMVLSTVCTGVGFWLMGHFQLGRLVRFIPYPVIGGFLGGTGWLLITGGISVMTDVPLGWSLFQPDVLLRWAPGLLFAVSLLFLLSRYSHFLLLPALLVTGVGLFYLVHYAATGSVSSAGSEGWLVGPFPSGRLWQPVTLRALANADWLVVAQNVVNMSTIFLISAISMLLNVSGLEIATRTDANLNRELKFTGVANVVAGLGGSAVGFHALSFSALGHQLGVRSRLTGPFMALLIGITLFFSAGLLSIFPRLIAGGFLIFLGLSFLVEWVYAAWFKLPRLDYLLIWLIVLTIVMFGFLPGVAMGILVAVVLFAIDYSRIDAVRHVLTGAQLRSRVLRPRLYEQLLQQRGEAIYILVLQGFLFFGSAHRLIEQIHTRIDHPDRPKPRFIVLDFRLVTGIDSSARFAFSRLAQLAHSQGITLVATHLPDSVQTAWREIGEELGGDTESHALPTFAELDGGLAWCEEQMLEIFTGVGLVAKPKPFVQQVAELLPAAPEPTDWLDYLQPGSRPAPPAAATRLERSLRRVQAEAGKCIVRQGQEAAGIYLLETGRAVVQVEEADGHVREVGILEANGIIGEGELYAQQKVPYSVVTSQPSIFLHLSTAELQAIEAEAPELAIAIHRVLAGTISERLVRADRLVQALQR